MMRRIERDSKGSMTVGQDLIVMGYAGLAGTVEIIKQKRQILEQWFQPDYLEAVINCYHSMKPGSPADWNLPGITEWEGSGEGGILKTLWDLSGAYETGIRFSLRNIPIRQETIEICERLELNPYRLYSARCWLLVSQNGGQTTAFLMDQNNEAEVIGTVMPGTAREMLGNGTTGYLERPRPDEIYKIIKEVINERKDFSSYGKEQQN
ncbi:MAG: AIR synthase-related protein [Lachnospiraceae bacterium]